MSNTISVRSNTKSFMNTSKHIIPTIIEVYLSNEENQASWVVLVKQISKLEL